MSLYEMIESMPLFAEFTEEEKKAFTEMNHSLLGFNEGDVVIKEGDLYASLYLLVKGTLSITKSGIPVALTTLGPGNIFGEMSFFTKKPRFSSVIANENALILRMDNNFFNKTTPEIRDKIKNFIIELLIQRLDVMNESLIKISKFARGSTMI